MPVRVPTLVLLAAAGCEGDAASPDAGGESAQQPPEPGAAADTVPLHGVWSYSARNENEYDNLCDFREIELEAVFESPNDRPIALDLGEGGDRSPGVLWFDPGTGETREGGSVGAEAKCRWNPPSDPTWWCS